MKVLQRNLRKIHLGNLDSRISIIFLSVSAANCTTSTSNFLNLELLQNSRNEDTSLGYRKMGLN